MSMFHELMMKKKGMPSNYQEVEYIESTGTQYIDTGYVVQEDDIIETDVQQMGVSDQGDKFLCGQQSADSSKGGTWIEQYGPNNNYYVRFGSLISGNQSYGAIIKVHYTLKKGLFISSNGDSLSLEFNSLQSTNLTLFGRFSADGTTFAYSKYKMWTFYITRNGRLVRNFIPVYDTLTQKYGMWESVQGKFYGNDGTGDFGGSIVGYTIVGSPTIVDGVVSGFSTSNYLQMQQNIKPTQSFEFKTKFNKTSSSPSNGLFSSRQFSSITSAGRFGIGLTCTDYIDFFVSYNGTSWGFDIVADDLIENNVDYYIKAGWTGEEYYVLISTDDINYVKIISHLSTTPPTSNIEYTTLGLYASTDRRFLSGNLYLNETYIKINGKLWFNGQQA